MVKGNIVNLSEYRDFVKRIDGFVKEMKEYTQEVLEKEMHKRRMENFLNSGNTVNDYLSFSGHCNYQYHVPAVESHPEPRLSEGEKDKIEGKIE